MSFQNRISDIVNKNTSSKRRKFNISSLIAEHMSKNIVLIGLIMLIGISTNYAYSQEIGLSTFQESAQLIIDNKISQNTTASITLLSTNIQEIRIPIELEEKLSKGLKSLGYEINSRTQIIQIIIGNEKTAMEFGKFLFKHGIFAQPIRYPTVPKNQARLRISVTAWLTNSDIEKSLKIFEKGYKKFF